MPCLLEAFKDTDSKVEHITTQDKCAGSFVRIGRGVCVCVDGGVCGKREGGGRGTNWRPDQEA